MPKVKTKDTEKTPLSMWLPLWMKRELKAMAMRGNTTTTALVLAAVAEKYFADE